MSNATEYADSIVRGIEENVNAGHPFGISTEDEPILDREIGEEGTAMDYLSDVLDIQYVVTSDRQYRSARVCIAFGGPTAWINTMTSQLEVAWWSEPVYRNLPGDFIDGLDDALEELWEMGI